MFKAIVLISRRDALTHDQFVRWWLDDHVPVASALPHLRRVVLNVVDEGVEASGIDAITELWFDSRTDFDAAQASPEGAAMAAHAVQGMGDRTRVFVTEHIPDVAP